jgi:transcriptional regulator with XRE-family HTH domain
MKETLPTPAKLARLSRLIDSLCGLYSRIARRLGVHRTYVSRVAHGERRSQTVEQELVNEYQRIRNIDAAD